MADESDKQDDPSSELDPELIKLPRPKARIRPLLAAAILLLCLTLVVRLLDDLSFSRQSETPRSLEPGAELTGDDLNDYIEITAHPDRPQALRLLPSGKSTGPVLVPARGHQGALWLLLPTTPWHAGSHYDERYQGRLLAMDDVDFEPALRSHVKKSATVPRPIPLASVRRALADKSQEIADAVGDRFELSPDALVRVEEIYANKVEILAAATDPYNSEQSWTLALVNAGLLPQDEGPVTSTTSSWTFHVPAPEGLAAVQAQLREAKLFAARAAEIRQSREGKVSELSLEGDQIHLRDVQQGYEVREVFIALPQPLAKNALVLDTTEKPSTYWYVLPLVLFLALIAGIFAMGLGREILRLRA